MRIYFLGAKFRKEPTYPIKKVNFMTTSNTALFSFYLHHLTFLQSFDKYFSKFILKDSFAFNYALNLYLFVRYIIYRRLTSSHNNMISNGISTSVGHKPIKQVGI